MYYAIKTEFSPSHTLQPGVQVLLHRIKPKLSKTKIIRNFGITHFLCLRNSKSEGLNCFEFWNTRSTFEAKREKGVLRRSQNRKLEFEILFLT